MKSQAPNPAGREGKPISLKPYSFDDALRKILGAKPPPKPAKNSDEGNVAHNREDECIPIISHDSFLS